MINQYVRLLIGWELLLLLRGAGVGLGVATGGLT